ncbi:MAG: cytochrome oxidase subunit III [Paraglaciecola sp.]|nr:cytochrome oxidase subunit III [Paraglaciecola sp.]
MNLIQKLTEKPWIINTDPALEDKCDQMAAVTHWPSKTALHFFLMVVSVVFVLLTITFLSRSQASDFQALAGEPWLPFTQTYVLWRNSLFLICASISLQASVYLSVKQNVSRTFLAIVAAYIFSGAFLLGQYDVWLQLSGMGYVISGNPANSFFYLLTGMHGLHLLGGIIALLMVIRQFLVKVDSLSFERSLVLCATYWHYLLGVWFALFALLTATSETYRNIALFCGF